jgi:hypothetical protein
MKTKKEKKAEALKDEEELKKNPINEFTCCNKTMGYKDFMVHLKIDHGLDAKKLEATKQLLVHIDGDYWFSYRYKFTLKSGLQFTQYTMQVRGPKMRRDY